VSAAGLLDHVVIAGPVLADVVAWFADRTGVTAAPGGVHPTGTANALVALTVDGQRAPRYVELIGPDPSRDVVPTTFGIDGLTEPTVVTYAVQPDDVAATVAAAHAAGHDAGEVADLSRRTPDGTLLEWRLARSDRFDVPFLIDWGSTQQPGLGALPTVEFVALDVVRADPAPTAAATAALGLPEGSLAPIVAGESDALRLTVRTEDGTLVTL